MLNDLTGEDIAAEAKMVRDAFNGTILLVESDDDILLFERFTNFGQCRILPGWGKGNVMTAIGLLEEDNFEGVLGIVDADFWNIIPPDTLSLNICVTDHHDMEIMIIESQALIRVLKEYGSEYKIRKFVEGFGGDDIRQILYRIVFPIGVLRILSSKKGLGLKFSGMLHDKIINKNSLEVEIDRLIKEIRRASTCDLSDAEIRSIFDQESSEQKEVDLSQLCVGDDVIAVICIGLRKVIGTRDSITASRNNIASALRLAYDSGDFKNTGLYDCIRKWEANNPLYNVLSI